MTEFMVWMILETKMYLEVAITVVEVTATGAEAMEWECTPIPKQLLDFVANLGNKITRKVFHNKEEESDDAHDRCEWRLHGSMQQPPLPAC